MSVQLDRYLEERAAGKSVVEASFWSGIDLTEAKLTEEAIAKGELELPHACAGARAREGQSKGETMERAEMTISVNGGPEHSLSEVREALDIVRGHNNGPTVAADELRLLIERVERVEEEIAGLNDDKKDIYAEAKSRGYDTKTMKRIVRLRAMEPHHRQEAAALLESYADAVGLQDALPL